MIFKSRPLLFLAVLLCPALPMNLSAVKTAVNAAGTAVFTMDLGSLATSASIMLAISATNAMAAEPSEAELLAGADARIERHRKNDATINVVDQAGKPLANAEITVEQTRHAFLFGAHIFHWGGMPNEKMEQAYRQQFTELLNYATLGFYWTGYEPTRGKPNHNEAETVARWCQQHGIQTKGHPLAWNYADAPWYPDDPAELYRLQLARIDDCVKRFTGLIDRWDVVNEAAEYQRDWLLKAAPKHSAMWKKIGQIAFVRDCFVRARQANPNATLLINDYCTAPPYEQVIKQLVDPNGRRLYDVIGIQSHMHGCGTWSTKATWDICQKYASFGVPLHFTETTIVSGNVAWDWQKTGDAPSTPEGEARQARDVVRFYTMLFSHPAVEAITWWDFCDYRSFLHSATGLVRTDMTPKPAYDELKKLIKGKWWTKTRLRTGNDGMATFRGFLGDYRITIRTGDKLQTAKAVSLTRGEPNRWTVTVP